MGRSLTSRIWRVPPLNLSPDTFFFGVKLRSFSRKFALGSNLRFSGFYFVKNGFFDFQKVLSCLSVGSPFAARPPNLKKSNVFSRVSKIERDEIRIRGKQFFLACPGGDPETRKVSAGKGVEPASTELPPGVGQGQHQARTRWQTFRRSNSPLKKTVTSSAGIDEHLIPAIFFCY